MNLIILGVVLLVLAIIALWFLLFRSKSPGTACVKFWRKQGSSKGASINVLPRRMWGWGLWADSIAGYCGEGSVQTSMIFHGNYISQEQVLKAAGGSLLFGDNHDACMKNLLNDYEYVGSNTLGKAGILAYLKKQIDAGFPVIAGLFVDEEGGDVSYDHLCTCVGYDLDSDGAIDNLYWCDGYLFYPYRMKASDCYKTRAQATPKIDYCAPFPIYIPNIEGVQDKGSPALNHMVTFKGNMDPKKELYPVMLEMLGATSQSEPNWGSEDVVGATPSPIACNCLISGLNKGTRYSLLRFDNPSDVPKGGDFLASGKFTLRVDFTAQCDTQSIPVQNSKDYPFMSNGTYFFRCVRNTGSTRSVYPKGTNRTDAAPFPPQPTPDMPRAPRFGIRRKHRGANAGFTVPLPGLTARRIRNARRHHKRHLSATASKAPFEECDSLGPAQSAKITCSSDGDSYGNIIASWQWQWPTSAGAAWDPSKTDYHGSSNYGCMKWKTSTLAQGQDIQVADDVCVVFELDTDDTNYVGEDGIEGVVGADGRLYIDCMDNPFFMSWSLGKANQDGSFTMLSQDGVTISKLIPSKKSA
jgi:hypothetical protein